MSWRHLRHSPQESCHHPKIHRQNPRSAELRRWTTTNNGKTIETDADLTVTFKDQTKTITGLRREIKDLEKQQAFVTLARVIKDQKKYGRTLLKHDNEGNYVLS